MRSWGGEKDRRKTRDEKRRKMDESKGTMRR
jgi:hypothetical protein